jgi:hypothetical protein
MDNQELINRKILEVLKHTTSRETYGKAIELEELITRIYRKEVKKDDNKKDEVKNTNKVMIMIDNYGCKTYDIDKDLKNLIEAFIYYASYYYNKNQNENRNYIHYISFGFIQGTIDFQCLSHILKLIDKDLLKELINKKEQLINEKLVKEENKEKSRLSCGCYSRGDCVLCDCYKENDSDNDDND